MNKLRIFFMMFALFVFVGVSVHVSADVSWEEPSNLLAVDEMLSYEFEDFDEGITGFDGLVARANDTSYVVFSNEDSDGTTRCKVKIISSSGYSTLTMGPGVRPRVAVDTCNRSYYTWVDYSTDTPAIHIMKYHNGGQSSSGWSYATNTTPIQSTIACNRSGSHVYVLCSAFLGGSSMGLFVAGSDDQGATWNSPGFQMVTAWNEYDLPGYILTGYHPSMAVDDDELGHIVLPGLYGAVSYFAVGSTGWGSWQTLMSPDSTASAGGHVSVAVSHGPSPQIYVAWSCKTGNTMFVYCKNLGTGSVVALSPECPGNNVEGPSMVVDNDGVLNMVWIAQVGTEKLPILYYSYNRSAPIILANSGPSLWHASICCDENNKMAMVYTEHEPPTAVLYYSESVPDWTNEAGDFDSNLDYSSYAYEVYESLALASTSWAPSYQGRNCLKVSFSNQNQGVKITPYSRFTTSAEEQWYRLRIVYNRDSSCNLLHFLPLVLQYESADNLNIKQIGGTFSGESNILPGNWIQYDTYVKCKTTSGHIQLALKNNGSSGNVYIDSIEFTPATPPALTNYTNVPISQGDFNVASDTTGWGFEHDSGKQFPAIFWDSTNQRLGFTFTSTSQEVKVTSTSAYNIAAGRNAVMSFNVYIASTTNNIDCSGYLYADGYSWPFDIGMNVLCSSIPTYQNYTVNASLSSQSNVTNARLPQFYIKSNTNIPITLYVDDIQLRYSNN